MTKTRQANDVTHHIGLVYAENYTELSIPMRLSVVSDKKQEKTTMWLIV